MNKPGDKQEVMLPNSLETTLQHIGSIVSAFNLPREVLASDQEVEYAWKELPREILRIPVELRDELIARMCVATSVGLFDGAVNYIWNAVILALRKKIKSFGLALVSQTLGKTFTEDDLNESMDSSLLDLAYKLQLISEEGFFFLNQCRDIRNNFSTAHPSMAQIDDRELINFISRCCKYGLTDEVSLHGVNVSEFLTAIKGRKMDHAELEIWENQLKDTFPAQRQMLVPSLMGIYCDPESTEIARVNALKISKSIVDFIDEKTKSTLLENYNKYFVKGLEKKYVAARTFFEKLGMLHILNEAEKNAIIKSACNKLEEVHSEFNNFYNEPPFAQRVHEIASQIAIPDVTKEVFVYTVTLCYVGNPYGVSNAAISDYEEMIKNFSPKEIDVLLKLPTQKTVLSDRIRNFTNCKMRYRSALNLIDKTSMTATQTSKYNELMK